MRINGNVPIAMLAAEVPGAVGVFETLGIDYACAGERTLGDAAHAEGIDPEAVIAALRGLRAATQGESWGERPLTDLTAHLVDAHHRFVRDDLAFAAPRLAELCTRDAWPELVSLRTVFTRMSDIVLPHLHREESDVFLAVKALENAWRANESVEEKGDLASAIRELTLDHGTLSAQLRTMRDLRLRLEAMSDLPPSARPVLAALAKLEKDLHESMFLENCVLFPRALAMEALAPG